MRRNISLALVAAIVALSSSAGADEATTPPKTETVDHSNHQYGPKPFHYALPFQLRPAITWNVVRSDTSVGFYDVNNQKGSALVTSLLVGYKVTEAIQPFVRIAYSRNAPSGGDATGVVSNPLAGVTYGIKPHDDIRVAAILAVSAPLGQGGGDNPNINQSLAQSTANGVRSAMDGALFAVNDVGIIPGVSAAYIAKGLTVQGEVTYVQLLRARGSGDSSRAVLTSGLHVGYFLIPQLSLGAELRHMRFLTTPAFLSNTTAEKAAERRDNTTAAFGFRLHLQLNDRFWLRPGASFSLPLDQPLAGSNMKMVQLDIPFVF